MFILCESASRRKPINYCLHKCPRHVQTAPRLRQGPSLCGTPKPGLLSSAIILQGPHLARTLCTARAPEHPSPNPPPPNPSPRKKAILPSGTRAPGKLGSFIHSVNAHRAPAAPCTLWTRPLAPAGFRDVFLREMVNEEALPKHRGRKAF